MHTTFVDVAYRSQCCVLHSCMYDAVDHDFNFVYNTTVMGYQIADDFYRTGVIIDNIIYQYYMHSQSACYSSNI